MKLFEKIIIAIFLILFALQLFDVVEHTMWLAFLLLSFSYLFGGYWLFNTKDNKNLFLTIISGIIFSASLIATFYKATFSYVRILNYMPFINGSLCLGLAIFWFVKNKAGKITKNTKYLFARSTVILMLSCFFFYSPASFKLYRMTMLSLNRGDAYTTNYFSMFDYSDKVSKALKDKDCDNAIEYAIKANTAGKNWLGDDTVKKANVEKIGRTFQDLYSAYRCKAETEYNSDHFEDALKHYSLADVYLNTFDYPSKYWNEEKSWSLKMIALCYMNIKKYEVADSLFLKALQNYEAVNGVKDQGFASLLSSFAMSASKELQFSVSNSIYKASTEIIKGDSINKKNLNILLFNYNQLALNYIHLDSLSLAIGYLQRALKIEEKNGKDRCETMVYYGVCLYRMNEFQNADSILKQSLACYQSYLQPNDQNIAECYLALSYNSIALAKFDEAKNYINKGVEITKNNYGQSNYRYANYLIVTAYLNEIYSNYATSEQQYNQAIRIYTDQLGNKNDELPNAFSGLAHVEISLSMFREAKEHADNAYAIAKNADNLNGITASELLNEVAYIDYSVRLFSFADTLYKKVIRLNSNYNTSLNAATAMALNGLGLIETEKNHYRTADSLFARSLTLHENIYKENHPFTANVYLNYAILSIREGKLTVAEEMLNKAFEINKRFFADDHDFFGDVFAAFGDLAKKKGENDIAKDYYRKALQIYKNKFKADHWKVLLMKRKT